MQIKKKGLLITFEGTEGTGKSTLIRALSKKIKNSIQTREPGGSPVAEAIRNVILTDFKKENMHPRTELFLYEASRIEHLERVILPALKAKKIIFCDRFTDSSLAYQAHARGLDWKMVYHLNQLATQGLKPDLTFLLKLSPKTGLKRASDPNRFEREGIAFQNKVLQGFLKAVKQDQKRWVVLDVDRYSKEELVEVALLNLKQKLSI